MENTGIRGFESAAGAVQGHLSKAVAAIDAAFGAGYAKENPQLVAAYLQACALEDISVSLAEIGGMIGSGLQGR